MTSPQTFYQALAGMEDGFFPLGVNGFPHGGIHLNNSVGMFETKDGVRCIADGYIVAYKIDDAYPHLQFKDGKWAMYSTGFVLVRHTLTLPPAPNSTGVQPADESQDIYSLYMHTADWANYLADEKLKRPWWWLDVNAFRVQNRDHQMAPPEGGTTGAAGALVWTEPKAGKKAGSFTAGEQVGFLPEGSEVIISETRGQWVRIKTITAGHMISPVNGGYFGWEDQNVPWKSEADSAKVTPKDDWGWLYKPNLHGIKEPDPVGLVVIPPKPAFVKAGTSLGQIGEYHDYERATPLPPAPKRQLLHLEVFADDGFSAFLDKSRARSAHLPVDQRTLLVINVGAKLVKDIPPADCKLCDWHPLYRADVTPDSPASGPWVKVQPRYNDSTTALLMPGGPPVWIEREKLATATATTPAWSQFPLSLQKVADPANAFMLVYPRSQLDGLSARDKAVDDGKTQWWRVKFGNADGHTATGWVRERDHPGTQWQSPWAWPGFERVDATGIDLADAFRRNLVLTGVADWKEQKEFAPSITAVNGSPLLQKLEQTISKLAPPPGYGAGSKPKQENPAGKVTATAMQAAMRTPWLAQALSHVILRYESEWGGDMSRWDAITPLMRNAKDNWLVELQRIRKLQWWNAVKGKIAGFPASATVLHIHPIALTANFMSAGSAKSISEDGIFFIFKQEALAGVTNRLHWPGGNSGVTLGAGYDMKARSAESIVSDMKSIGVNDAAAHAISAAAGLSGHAALDFCKKNLGLVNLSDEKQVDLLRKTVPAYEKMVIKAIKIDLLKHEFDALVSYAYNPGGGWASVTNFINHINIEQAMNNIKKYTTSGGVAFDGLVKRRADEVTLYTTGRYEFHGDPLPPRQ
ncbi:glycoside hydrolase family protein [Paraburkholderia phytofirmans]|uniref:glycoside hydrolase family protein n=1 Tax=Paraburkholderia TaxID=1822464 RepID=UPI001EEEF503|nr:glycoside hydrolase family protein [Paraburkholderia phytofirmans]